jgi:hypothetical protein
MHRAAAAQLGARAKIPRGASRTGRCCENAPLARAMRTDKTLTSIVVSSLSDHLVASARLCWLSMEELEGPVVSNALLLMVVVAPLEFLV